MGAAQPPKGTSAGVPPVHPSTYAHDPTSSYTRPPPGYAGPSEPGMDPTSPLLGATRSSLDNLPDDFKYSTNVAEATVDIRMAFVRKVYAILSVQLAATAIVSSVSFFNTNFRSWIQSNAWMMWLSIFGSLAFLLLTLFNQKRYPMNLIFLTGFTLFEAYTIGVVVSFYEAAIVLEAVLITMGIFLALTLFACQTKYDFTGWMPWLFGLLTGLIIFGLVSMFFPKNDTMELVYAGGVALLFSAYILVDTQLIMRKFHVEEEIGAAIALYLDILNLFLAILRLLSRDN